MKIRAKGPGKWQCVWELGVDETGRRRQVTEMVYGTRAEAEARWIQRAAALQRPGRRDPRPRTVGDVVDVWLAHVQASGTRPRTLESYQAMVARFVRPTLGAVPLHTLTTGTIQAAVDQWARMPRQDGRPGPLSPRTVAYALACLRMALAFAVQGEWLDRNPDTAVSVRVPPRAETWWDPETATRFLTATRSHRWAAAWWLALRAGLRLGEVLALQWADCDLDAGVCVVQRAMNIRHPGQFGPVKGVRGGHPVVVDPETVAVLRATQAAQAADRARVGAAWQDEGWVIATHTGHWVMPRNLVRAFHQAQRAVGVPPIRFHDLRHSHATHLMAAGVPLRVVADRLGHADPHFTARRYLHSDTAIQREWIVLAFGGTSGHENGGTPPQAPP